MAAPKETPLFVLPKDVQARLTAQETDISKARKAMEVMKSLGMDVADIEEKLKWAENVRSTLLREFV